MAIAQLVSPMLELSLEKNYTIQFAAIDPDTGLAVSGVTVNNVSITTDQATDFTQTTPVPPNINGAYLPASDAGLA